ncbi:hypothetical protein [Paenibacillus sp. Soil724D2]|uniref:hypothetical protein n=1 Tax=Paenibacillus sp. (strain Soil724D2) TaxID=1736392 RepID=UPI0012E33266|nr:hypothetical protein [Paenibacillus sp. Soil724D2]
MQKENLRMHTMPVFQGNLANAYDVSFPTENSVNAYDVSFAKAKLSGGEKDE